MKLIRWPETAAGNDSPRIAMQLAFDEACLIAAETQSIGSSLRVWEFSRPVVVLGRSSKFRLETDVEECQSRGVEIFRRCSGGASIAGGPGCLMYSVVLSHADQPESATIQGAHDFVMGRLLSAVKTQLPDSRRDGICDLVWRNRKFSGNALRVARSHTLYHGTVLYGYDVELIEHCLAFAPRQPTYRQGRSHDAFVTNAPIDPVQLSLDLTIGFSAVSTVSNEMIRSQVRPIADRLVDERYGRNEWRFKR